MISSLRVQQVTLFETRGADAVVTIPLINAAPALASSPDPFTAVQTRLLSEAEARLADNPADADALIWKGRRLGISGANKKRSPSMRREITASKGRPLRAPHRQPLDQPASFWSDRVVRMNPAPPACGGAVTRQRD